MQLFVHAAMSTLVMSKVPFELGFLLFPFLDFEFISVMVVHPIRQSRRRQKSSAHNNQQDYDPHDSLRLS